MSFFPRFVSHNHEFSPIFRLLDDFATISRSNLPSGSSIRTFTPRFDVRELKDAYELHGELPGVEQKDIDIQWEDSQTLTIKGRVEHRSERGERPAAPATEDTQEKPAVEAAAEEDQHSDYHKPSVEDEWDDASDKETTATVENDNDTATVSEKETAVTKGKEPAAQQVQQPQASPSRYWISERSVGQFQRSFSFAGRIDQDAVRASLKNGVLTIVVPKAQVQKPRKITVE